MSTPHADSVEPETGTAAELSATSRSVAASIPVELFENILTFVGDEGRLGVCRFGPFLSSCNSFVDPNVRREEIKQLSACALTCVYWARLIRKHIFSLLILRSSEDMSSLQSLFRAPQKPRIPPIRSVLRDLEVLYTLGDHPWFHNLAGIAANCGVPQLRRVCLRITGPATGAFDAASTQGHMRHPLFFATPRPLLVMLPESCELYLYIKNIHLPNPTMVSNLLQDCLSLRPYHVKCLNLTWDVDPALQATPPLIRLGYACTCRTADKYLNTASGCTDNGLVAAMLTSVPHHGFAWRRRGPHHDFLETSHLFHVMRTTWHQPPPPGLERVETLPSHLFSDSDPDSIQNNVAVRLPTGTDFCLAWGVNFFKFSCIASQLPSTATTGNDVRNITYVIIELRHFDSAYTLREEMKTVNIDWHAFLCAIRQFPHLREIAIQHGKSSTHETLMEFLSHLGEIWFTPNTPLRVYYREQSDSGWAQLRLSTVMNDIEERREYLKSGMANRNTPKALSYGTFKDVTSMKDMDQELLLMIAETWEDLENLPLTERETVLSLFMQNIFIQPYGEVKSRSSRFVNRSISRFKFHGRPDPSIVAEALTWFADLIQDGDVLESTAIDINAMAKIVAQSGAAIQEFMNTIIRKKESYSKDIVKIGVLRFPDMNHPYFEVYHIRLFAWFQFEKSALHWHRETSNGIGGGKQSSTWYRKFSHEPAEFLSHSFEPRRIVLDQLDAGIKDQAIAGILNTLFLKHAVRQATFRRGRGFYTFYSSSWGKETE